MSSHQLAVLENLIRGPDLVLLLLAVVVVLLIVRIVQWTRPKAPRDSN